MTEVGLLSRAQESRAIKTALKERGINCTVAQGRGTAWNWITVNVGPCRHISDPAARLAWLMRTHVIVDEVVAEIAGEYREVLMLHQGDVEQAMTIWKAAANHARQFGEGSMWQIQQYVFEKLEQDKATMGWTEQECVDAARWIARKRGVDSCGRDGIT